MMEYLVRFQVIFTVAYIYIYFLVLFIQGAHRVWAWISGRYEIYEKQFNEISARDAFLHWRERGVKRGTVLHLWLWKCHALWWTVVCVFGLLVLTGAVGALFEYTFAQR